MSNFEVPVSTLNPIRPFKWKWFPRETITLTPKEGYFPFFDVDDTEQIRLILEQYVGKLEKHWDWRICSFIYGASLDTRIFKDKITIRVFGKRAKSLTFVLLMLDSKLDNIEISTSLPI